ncbi:MAG: adenylate/guanylate cyclase domain-containing protein [Verrucomicrobiae bacterium]|nr:adenylate/guanylate cyclase domain-containing protein [Verrucomicrobiae bacterium]
MGRGTGNDLVLQDTMASRTHAVIRQQSDKNYYLVDLGSSNGTFLNNRRVTIPVALKNSDAIQIGNCHIEFVTAQAVEAPAADDGDEMRTQVSLKQETISILVMDIRNYTGLSEGIPAEQLSKIVGKWFNQVQSIIEQHGGGIDKFIGDAVMAIWRKANTQGDLSYITGPLESAREMIVAARDYHQMIVCDYPKYGFAVGCGIHTGRAILGNVGEYTAVGDSVNVAFRIESLCKGLQRPILLSEDVQKAAPPQFSFEDLGLHKVKGKSQDIHIFSLTS